MDWLQYKILSYYTSKFTGDFSWYLETTSLSHRIDMSKENFYIKIFTEHISTLQVQNFLSVINIQFYCVDETVVKIPEDFIPVIFDKIHVLKWNSNVLTNKFSILHVTVRQTLANLIFLIPILHKNSNYFITLNIEHLLKL